MEKQIKLHHSITENGNLQLRQIVEYVKDGEVKDKKYSHPETPADSKNMKDWDVRSQYIISAITTPEVKRAFEAEKQSMTGIGIEEIVTYDQVIKEDAKIAVRRITRIFDEGIEVSKRYHRSWIMPGQDASDADMMSKVVADKLHTPEVIATYQEKMVELAAINL